MRWKQFFTPVQSFDSAKARHFLDNAKDEVEILDVRQPSEYEKSHIAGAKLIPLPILGESLDQLDPNKPILVY